MNDIIITNEEKRPMIVCPHCKSKIIVDIRPFNKDLSQLAKYTCNVCRKEIYAGLLLLSAPRLNTLLESINKVINAVGEENTLKLGD